MAYRYKTVKIAGKTKLLHRHVMELSIGRKLSRSEHVHHRNEDTHDNRIENLEIISAKDHAFHHKQKYPLTKICEYCGVEFTPHPMKRKLAKTCSAAHGHLLAWQKRRCPDIAAALVAANVPHLAVGRLAA